MGEIAEAYLNGDFDFETGEWIGPGDGYPRTLQRMQADSPSRRKRSNRRSHNRNDGEFACSFCGRRPSTLQGLNDHIRVVHKAASKDGEKQP